VNSNNRNHPPRRRIIGHVNSVRTAAMVVLSLSLAPFFVGCSSDSKPAASSVDTGATVESVSSTESTVESSTAVTAEAVLDSVTVYCAAASDLATDLEAAAAAATADETAALTRRVDDLAAAGAQLTATNPADATAISTCTEVVIDAIAAK